jgi:hypothetical protein
MGENLLSDLRDGSAVWLLFFVCVRLSFRTYFVPHFLRVTCELTE